MTSHVVVVIIICVIVYGMIVFKMIKNTNSNKNNDKIIHITAPTPEEITKEKEYFTDSFSYPDDLFEKMVSLILNDDPNPRKVVKLIEKYFSEKDRKMLLHCLSINNPPLHNEILSLLYCNTDSFEEFESKEYNINIDTPINYEPGENEQTGVPASFFIVASETIKNPTQEIYAKISIAYESLDPEKQKEILKQCEGMRKRKRSSNTKKEGVSRDFHEIVETGQKTAELFMELFNQQKENI